MYLKNKLKNKSFSIKESNGDPSPPNPDQPPVEDDQLGHGITFADFISLKTMFKSVYEKLSNSFEAYRKLFDPATSTGLLGENKPDEQSVIRRIKNTKNTLKIYYDFANYVSLIKGAKIQNWDKIELWAKHQKMNFLEHFLTKT